MSVDLLVGSTGFVGGNLAAKHTFAAACHSSDIAVQYGTRPADTNWALAYYKLCAMAWVLAHRDFARACMIDLDTVRFCAGKPRSIRHTAARRGPSCRLSRLLPHR